MAFAGTEIGERMERPDNRDKPSSKRGFLSVLPLVLQDLLLAGLFLSVFALFHHGLPRTELFSAKPDGEPAATAQLLTTAAPAETESAGKRSDWQVKFAAHFTDSVVSTENFYTSPTVSITLTTCRQELDGYPQVWYVADIYIARIENFQTYVENDSYDHFIQTPADELAQMCGALIGINGDYCNAQVQEGFYVRNGVLYQRGQTLCDICVLYRDGTMQTYAHDEYKVDDVLARDPYQVWKFGPALLDGDGQPLTEFNTPAEIAIGNPRSGFGYYEPGHYCFVTVDGRQDGWSRGLTIEQFARLFSELGCKAAYNLDGGASVTMTFMGALYNRQSSERELGDILLIKELPEAGVQP